MTIAANPCLPGTDLEKSRGSTLDEWHRERNAGGGLRNISLPYKRKSGRQSSLLSLSFLTESEVLCTKECMDCQKPHGWKTHQQHWPQKYRLYWVSCQNNGLIVGRRSSGWEMRWSYCRLPGGITRQDLMSLIIASYQHMPRKLYSATKTSVAHQQLFIHCLLCQKWDRYIIG